MRDFHPAHLEAEHLQARRESLESRFISGWTNDVISFSEDEMLPDDKVDAQKLQHLATIYVLLRGFLNKKPYSRLHSIPSLRSLGPEEARSLMHEIHDGDCENHMRGQSLAHKAINRGYY